MKLAAFVGRIVLFLASMAVIAGISLFVAGAYLTTWPLLRMSPRDRRTQAMVNATVAAMGVVQAFTPEPREPEPENTDGAADTYPSEY